ncbi:MAG: response regulator [Acidobacteriota bacterium]
MQPEQRVNILLVDDYAKNLLALEAILEDLGQNLVKANSGAEALKHLLEQEFALILLDVQMPEMDGFETAALIREREKTCHTPIIFLTAISKNTLHVFKGYSLGAVDYIFKPIVPEILRSKVTVFIELYNKTEQIKRQAELLREIERQEHEKEKAQTLAALHDSKERFRATFDWVASGIALVDLNGRIIESNPALQKMLDRSTEELHNSRLNDYTYPDDIKLDQQLYQELIAGQRDHYQIEKRFLSRQGELLWGRQTISAVRDANGKPQFAVSMIDNITEHRQAEKALYEKEEQLRQAQKMEAIGRLAGGMAHDFNNLLTAILGFSELTLNKLEQNHPLRPGIREIMEAGERAATLTHQLLAFSRHEASRPRVLDLNALIAGMHNMIGRLIGEDIDMATLPSATLPWVKADVGQLEQIIMNLVVNGRDAMPQGGKLTIETTNVELDDPYTGNNIGVTPGCYVMLAVSDTGCGMEKEIISHIFEPFFTTKEKGKGTGLGLSTVYGIVKQNGGHIKVYSEPGRGATFKIYLPQVNEATEQVEVAKVAPVLSPATETILLVEDEIGVRELMKYVLSEEGYTVLEAYDGCDALHICECHNGKIDLLITDVVMPKMSGQELVERLTEKQPNLRVLYISGYADRAIVRHGLLEEGSNFLEKPFTATSLTRKLREVLDTSEKI